MLESKFILDFFIFTLSFLDSISSNWRYTTLLSLIDLPILPTIFFSTNLYVGQQYETLHPQPLWDLALQISPQWCIDICHSVVFTAKRVKGAAIVANGVLSQLQPDLSPGAHLAIASEWPGLMVNKIKAL